MATPATTEMVIADGGEYYNKGFRCIWIRDHSGTSYKFIVATAETAGDKNLATELAITSPDTVATDEDQSS